MMLDLIFTLRDKYINSNLDPHTEFSTISRSIKLKDFFPWNISEMIMKTVPISTRIVISYAMKRVNHFRVSSKSNMTTIFQWKEATVEQILAPEEMNKCKRATL